LKEILDTLRFNWAQFVRPILLAPNTLNAIRFPAPFMSKIKTEKNRDNRRDIELPPNAQSDAPLEVEEQTGAEKLLMASQPYWSHIALALLVGILAWVIVSYMMQSSREAAAEPSRQLADAMQQFNVTSNVDSLKQMQKDYPNEIATNWAMLVAGDYEP